MSLPSTRTPDSTMSRMTIHSIVGMPELAECLSSYLTAADVACAMATCRAWSKQLQPFLWTNFCPTHMLPGMDAIRQNLHHIRTIDLNQQTIHSFRNSDFQSFCDLLKTLAHNLPVMRTSRNRESIFFDEHYEILTRGLSRARLNEVAVVHESAQSIEGRVGHCTKLKRIKLVLGRSNTAMEKSIWLSLTTLLDHNSRLTHLDVEIDGQYEFSLSPMIQMLRPLSRLHHLTIRVPMQEESWFLSLLRVCLPLPRLSELYCHFNIEPAAHSSDGDAQDKAMKDLEAAVERILLEAVATRTSENGLLSAKITAIEFPDLQKGDNIRLMLPIMSSGLVEIETLVVPRIFSYRSGDFYEAMVRENCLRLRHLVLPPNSCSMLEIARGFIRGATGLRTVRGHDCAGGYRHYSKSTNIISTLEAHHSKTLEELELLSSGIISWSEQQAILASCKNLKRFWVTADGRVYLEKGIRRQVVVDREWACLGLKELHLSLDRTIYDRKAKAIMHKYLRESRAREILQESVWEELEEDENDLSQRGNEEQQRQVNFWTAKLVFTQIGRLSVLQTLSLEIERGPYSTISDDHGMEWDLTLYKGWLAELSGLKNLRHLHMTTDFWSRMGQEEVEFMDAEWPLLGDISFSMRKQELPMVVKQAHWEWLREKRPNLRLRALQL